MIVTAAEMKALEQRAFSQGISAEALMEDAGAQIAAAVRQFFPAAGRCVVHFGKGHNGGDALVAARHLAAAGWALQFVPAFPEAEWSRLTLEKAAQLATPPESQSPAGGLVVLDGLLGIGAGGALREPILGAAREINRLRREEDAHIFAIDLPTGLNADTGSADPDAVLADFTLAIGFAKVGLLADAATRHVGRLAVLPLRALGGPVSDNSAQVTCAADLAPLLPRRAFDVHKGDFGRIGLVAGSRGFSGAALMAAEACVKAGGGLVSLYVTEDIHTIVAAAAPPEIMVKPVSSYLEVLETNRDVLALGPGLGHHRREEVLELISRAEQPTILDADALNIASGQLDILERCAGPRLLTPHPGEMARLDPDAGSRSRRETVETFIARFPHTLLLKGARTIVAERGRPLSFNTTGSPGMASGGMGDVLTGVCAALVGHGLSLYDAARAGAWLCGRAAGLAIFRGGESEESLTATRVVNWLGPAFKELRARSY